MTRDLKCIFIHILILSPLVKAKEVKDNNLWKLSQKTSVKGKRDRTQAKLKSRPI